MASPKWSRHCARTQIATSGLSAALGTMPQETELSLNTVGVFRDGPQYAETSTSSTLQLTVHA